jgi:hypothetical protein
LDFSDQECLVQAPGALPYTYNWKLVRICLDYWTDDWKLLGNPFHSGEVDRKTYMILKSIMSLSESFLVACFQEVIKNLGKKGRKCFGNDANMSFLLYHMM